MMLWILLLAVLFTFYRPVGWRDLTARLGSMACLAVLFAFVGNRGLIRNSVHYARFVSWPVAAGKRLEFDLETSSPSTAQLFWDTGRGMNETESLRQDYEPHRGLQTLRFPLPDKPLRALRFDPRDGEGRLEIRGIRVVDGGQRTCAVLPLDALRPVHDIAKLHAEADTLLIETSSASTDPITQFTAAATAIVNRALAEKEKP